MAAGTHDNETMMGWYKDSATPREKAYLAAYLGTDGSDIAWDMIRLSYKSVSQSAIFLLQVLHYVQCGCDFLCLIIRCESLITFKATQQ